MAGTWKQIRATRIATHAALPTLSVGTIFFTLDRLRAVFHDGTKWRETFYRDDYPIGTLFFNDFTLAASETFPAIARNVNQDLDIAHWPLAVPLYRAIKAMVPSGSTTDHSVTVSGSTVTFSGTAGSGSGTVALNPAGGAYAAGAVVTLTATPASGSVFAGWSGGATGTTNPVTITMPAANTAVTATFNAAPRVLRSSGGSDPRVFIKSVMRPFFPNAATRMSSSAASSAAVAMAADSSAFKLSRVSAGFGLAADWGMGIFSE